MGPAGGRPSAAIMPLTDAVGAVARLRGPGVGVVGAGGGARGGVVGAGGGGAAGGLGGVGVDEAVVGDLDVAGREEQVAGLDVEVLEAVAVAEVVEGLGGLLEVAEEFGAGEALL